MREKYESLSVAVLRDLAKARGIPRISAMKKRDLVEAMLRKDEEEAAAQKQPEKETQNEGSQEKQPDKTQERGRVTQARRGRDSRDKDSRDKDNKDKDNRDKNSREKDNRDKDSREKDSREKDSRDKENREKENKDIENKDIENKDRDNDREKGQPSMQPERRRTPADLAALDSGRSATGVLEVMADGYGFLRGENYLSSENDVYVAPSQIRKFNLKTGDIVTGSTRMKTQQEKYSALLYIQSINGFEPSEATRRYNFEDMTPVFPNERLRMEREPREVAMRIVDLLSPVGKGQRGMIVSPPKAGKTTLLKAMATSILRNNPDMHIIIMLIDERPEEVTDIREAIVGENVEVLYSTFDELPDHHRRVSEMGIERAKRLVEYGHDVTILLDSITRLARAYNLIVAPSGRTLSGGLDPAALHMPKRFFGAARNMREGGSLTILATALVDTGSKMDDVVYEEFKGTGNMELVLDRKLSERRLFPAIDIVKSGTRREDLLLDQQEIEAVYIMRRALNGLRSDEAVENILNMFAHTRSNAELVDRVRRTRTIG